MKNNAREALPDSKHTLAIIAVNYANIKVVLEDRYVTFYTRTYTGTGIS